MENGIANVLVADDDPIMRMLARNTLEKGGLRVAEADNGEEALRWFGEVGSDLILLDVMMPGLDGFAVCKRLRQMPGGLHVPIIMMTGLDDESSIQRAYEVGATDFMIKPVNWPILAQRVRYILRASAALRELAWRAEFQRVLIDTIPAPILVEDAEGRALVCNPALEALLGGGCDAVEQQNRSGRRVLPDPPNAAVFSQPDQQQVYEAELTGADWKRRSVIIHRAAFTPPGAGEPGVISAVLDITERKRDEEQLRLADTVFQAAADAIMVIDAEGLIKSVNPAFTVITGYRSEDVIGQSPRLLLNPDRHGPRFHAEFWRVLQETGAWSGEVWQRRKNNDPYPTWQSVTAVRDAQGCSVEYVAFFSDMTQRKLAEQEIFFRANYDPLTGLPNRSLLHERIDQALKRARRQARRVGLMFLDIDRFKQVNDILGHGLGDALLCQVAERLKTCVRETDTVARYGGDEFVLVLPDVVQGRDACLIAEKVIEELAEPFDLEGHLVRGSASLGIALYPDHGQDVTSLLRHADLALYQAKAAGRNTYRNYEAVMTDQMLRQLCLETDLRRALDRDELTVHYQPILDVESGRLAGAEALIRWLHPKHGMVPPNEFIPLAEETGLIREVGDWVLERVCQTIRRWREIGLNVPVSVNLSGGQILRGLSVETVRRLLERYDLRPEMLSFEITESVLLNDTPLIQQWLGAVRDLGIRVDIDDFGTGYSSLAYLKRFPVDRIKIDRYFVCEMVANANDQALVEAILSIARSLRLTVVAEGVEDREQLAMLRRLGCEYAQGFYFSRPVADEEFIKIAGNLGALTPPENNDEGQPAN